MVPNVFGGGRPMAKDYAAQLESAIEAFKALRGPPALAQLGRIADLAEAHADEQTVVDALCQTIRDAHHLELVAPQVAALQRLHALYKSNPRYDFAREQMLWYHKWVAESLVESTEVSREMIEAMFSRVEAVYVSEKMGLRPIHMLRCRTAWMMGRDDEAAVHYDRWQATAEGKSDDCPACEVNGKVEFLLAVNRIPEAMQAAEPLLDGSMHCDEVPANTFSRLLIVAMNAGDEQLAEWMHRSTLRIVRHLPDLLACLARHVVYLTLTGRAQQIRRLASLTLGRAARASDYNRLGAYVSGMLWFSVLAREGVAKVKLPREFHLARQQRDVATPEGAAWCLEQANALAARFDARNGTPLFTKRLHESENLIRAICSRPD
jgi:hypothetical protein